jgi:hypothetical protein
MKLPLILGLAALVVPLLPGCTGPGDRPNTLVSSRSSAHPGPGGALTSSAPSRSARVETGFVSLFDGQTLNGWRFVGKAGEEYRVRDGAIVAEKGVHGNLFTEKSYADFVLRFDFMCADPGANNGLGIRAPLDGDAAYVGMELQILEESGAEAKFGKLRPEQFHGSVYDVFAAKRGAMKPVGQWNTQEVVAQGRHIKVSVNGQVILDVNLNDVKDIAKLQKHPGLFREAGHIGFLGHDDHVEFRNIRIKELPRTEADNVPPEGFVALFNGRDLTGWKGLLKEPNDNPIKRAALSAAARAAAQQEADENMRAHWKVANGQFVFDGKGRSLATARSDYRNFEMLVDWKIPARADSGIYLRGSPQVQIWDPHTKPTQHGSEVGSGGFYNNQKNPSKPSKVADRPIGEWNRFRMVMLDQKAHIFLNGELVVNNVTLENYWDRNQPIFPAEQIELQNHGNELGFKNIYIRELPPQ